MPMATPAVPPQKYVMLQHQQSTSAPLPPPPNRRRGSNVPRYNDGRRNKSGGRCLKCLCCCCCVLVLVLFILAALVFYFYTVFQPKIPTYHVDHFAVDVFNISMDLTLRTELAVTVKADNPNNHIGFIYGQHSSVSVSYADDLLCSGKLPAFHHGHRNVTLMKVLMKGATKIGADLQQYLIEDRKSGKIPLLIKVAVPVTVVVGSIHTRQIKVLVDCNLVINNISPKKPIKILSTKYNVDVQF